MNHLLTKEQAAGLGLQGRLNTRYAEEADRDDDGESTYGESYPDKLLDEMALEHIAAGRMSGEPRRHPDYVAGLLADSIPYGAGPRTCEDFCAAMAREFPAAHYRVSETVYGSGGVVTRKVTAWIWSPVGPVCGYEAASWDGLLADVRQAFNGK